MKTFRGLGIAAVLFSIIFGLSLVESLATPVLSTQGMTMAPLLTTTGNPANYVVSPPSFYDGVGKIIVNTSLGTIGGSGSLLPDGTDILTAAHLLTYGGSSLNVNSLSVTFSLSGGPVTYYGASYFVYPGWDGNFQDGNDIAIVRLSTSVPLSGYQIFTDKNFMGGSMAQLAGYGLSGTGSTGTNQSLYPFGTLRTGENKLDTVWNITGNPFAYDFDNGTFRRDTIGNLTLGVLRDLGTGINEVMTAPGDSGGPSFINGEIAGIHSFGATLGKPFDVDNQLNSSFGELGGDTRVAFYADWVNTIDSPVVPEPSTFLLLGSGLISLVGLMRKLKR